MPQRPDDQAGSVGKSSRQAEEREGKLGSRDIEWIVCHAVERLVVDGRVSCPYIRAGDVTQTAGVEDCLLCRHLIATPADRRPDGTCAIELEQQ